MSRDHDRLIVTPIITSRQIQPSSIDLRLGFHFKIVRNVGIGALDPLRPVADLRRDTERYTHDVHTWTLRPFYVHPGQFALGTTLEYLRIPNDLAASLEGRSSLGRLGVTIHATAGFIDPGFTGRITYEIRNEGTQPVALYAGMRIAQICFITLSSPSIRAYSKALDSKYQQQLTTTSSLWYTDKELDWFRQQRQAQELEEQRLHHSPDAASDSVQ
jgi:dCTP deaminase